MGEMNAGRQWEGMVGGLRRTEYYTQGEGETQNRDKDARGDK